MYGSLFTHPRQKNSNKSTARVSFTFTFFHCENNHQNTQEVMDRRLVMEYTALTTSRADVRSFG